MNVIALDYGTKRIGLAWMQSGLDVVLPFGIIANKDIETTMKEIVSLIKEEHINLLIIGLPVTLEDGTENSNTKRVRAFADILKKHISIPIEFVDERLSSFEADEMGGSASRDEKAAMVILSTYKDMSNTSESTNLP